MKLSKHLHSCLLIEENNKTVLIDPGNFTYQEQALSPETIKSLDYILITHEHPDHMHVPFIKDLVKQFPAVKIISNPSVKANLQQEIINVHTDLSELPDDVGIQFEELAHEQLWDSVAPQNVLFNVFGKITHPGDSYHVEATEQILALPVQAPWGSTKAAVELALRLKPQVIIPIHDYMWKDDIRKAIYKRLQDFFNQKGIDFKPLETGDVIEV